MSFRGSLRPALGSVRPAHFLPALAVVLVETGLSFAVGVASARLPTIPGTLLASVGALLVLALTLPLLAAVYVPVVERAATARGVGRVAVGAVRRWYRPLFVANAASLAVALCAALAAAVAWFLVSTAVRYAAYVTGDPVAPPATRPMTELALAAAVGLVAGALVTRFADLFVVLDGESPRTAWRSSVGLVRRHPVPFLGYAAVVGLLGATPRVLERSLGSADSPAALATGLAVVAAVGCVCTVVGAAIHVSFFRRTVDSAGRETGIWERVSRIGGSPARVVVVAVVLVAAVAGAGHVRAADLGTGGDEIRPLPDDPDAALAVAANNTAGASQRRTVAVRNASESDDAFRTIHRTGIDHEQRRAYTYIDGPDGTVGSYFAEGTFATYNAGSWRTGHPLLSRHAGNWTVLAFPGYGMNGDHMLPVPDPAADWTVVDRGPSATTYRVEDPDAVRTALDGFDGTLTGEVTDESYVTVVVDRDRGVLRSLEARLSLRDGGRDRVYRIEFEAVGTAEVDRPDVFGPRNAAERLLDVLYY